MYAIVSADFKAVVAGTELEVTSTNALHITAISGDCSIAIASAGKGLPLFKGQSIDLAADTYYINASADCIISVVEVTIT